MHAHKINAEGWNTYGQRKLGHAYMPPVPERLQWGPWEGVGPGPKYSAISPANASWTSAAAPATTPSTSPALTAPA
ncbi:hypothetical protein AB0J38_07305 [Streptomyces sp. NPDC050095]|uniref:hypothetical protein n=1 Tax=unclassified Streptomyces TaxID=2593676 RepID=UPI003426B161